MSAVTFEQYLDDPDAAAMLIEAEVERELQAKGLPKTTKASFPHLLTHIKTNGFELQRLHQRIDGLEKRIDGMSGCMKYRGEWHAGYEFDDGDLVEHAGGLHLAVQPIHDNNPPHRGNGWVRLTGA